MHPAFSVIFFTTATGAGYGLLALLGVFAAFGLVPPDRWLGFVGLGLCARPDHRGCCPPRCISAGLSAPGARFRNGAASWLSREGVASVATYIPAVAVCASAGSLLGRTDGWVPRPDYSPRVGAVDHGRLSPA